MTLNIIFQIFHPSTRTYKKNIEQLHQEFSAYKKTIERSFIPELEKIIKASIPNMSKSSLDSFSFSPTNQVNICARPFVHNGRIGFETNGWLYYTGDLYMLEPILHITRDCFCTRSTIYKFDFSEGNASSSETVPPSETKETDKTI